MYKYCMSIEISLLGTENRLKSLRQALRSGTEVLSAMLVEFEMQNLVRGHLNNSVSECKISLTGFVLMVLSGLFKHMSLL